MKFIDVDGKMYHQSVPLLGVGLLDGVWIEEVVKGKEQAKYLHPFQRKWSIVLCHGLSWFYYRLMRLISIIGNI